MSTPEREPIGVIGTGYVGLVTAAGFAELGNEVFCIDIDADLSAVHAVVNSMPASDRHALVMKSTVPAGTGASIKRIFSEQGKEGFRYVSCPEFLKEGSAVKDFLNPDRVVVGDDGDWAGDAVVELYRPLEAPLVRTDVASAEMVKLATNAVLAPTISFISEIANVCEETG